MKAVAITQSLPVADPKAFLDIDLPQPQPGPRDLLVRVAAVSINPVDAKVRGRYGKEAGAPKVLGYDAAGTVAAVGAEVALFKSGDAVYYAGDITRPGTNSEFHLVDERIAGHKPATLDFAEAASLPLTALTAWELLFHRMRIDAEGGTHRGKTLLILAGAGGVGSMAIQFAKRAGLSVIATASRAETQEWCRALGADHVIDHRQPLAKGLETLGLKTVDYVINLVDTDGYWDQVAQIIAPQGAIGLIVEPKHEVRIGNPLKDKSVSIHWEMMFTRADFKTADMIEQHRTLERIAQLVDAGAIRTALTTRLKPINAATVREAHRLIESGETIGKTAIEGW